MSPLRIVRRKPPLPERNARRLSASGRFLFGPPLESFALELRPCEHIQAAKLRAGVREVAFGHAALASEAGSRILPGSRYPSPGAS